MSHGLGGRRVVREGFPRVSGDEPECRVRGLTFVGFSPRERG